MHWRRKWQPTPVFLPGESQGWEAWWAAVYGVAQSRTQLKRLSSSSSRGQKRQIPAVLRQSGRRKRGPETGVGGICGMSAAPHSLPRPDSYHLLLLTAQDAGQQLQWEAGSWASLVAQLVKNPPAMPETWVQSLGWEDPGKKRTATHSSILAWRVHGSQRVGLSDFQREAGASQVALVVKNLHANARELRDTGSIPKSGRSPGEGNGNPPQYSCLENPMDRGAQRGTVHGVAKSRT